MKYKIPGGQSLELTDTALIHHQPLRDTVLPLVNIAHVKLKKKVLIGYDRVIITMNDGKQYDWHVIDARGLVNALSYGRAA